MFDTPKRVPWGVQEVEKTVVRRLGDIFGEQEIQDFQVEYPDAWLMQVERFDQFSSISKS